MNLLKSNRLAFFSFAPVAIVAIIINQYNFAIGDDYHGISFYFLMTGADLFSALSLYWESPFMAGRPFAGFGFIYGLDDGFGQPVLQV